MATKSPAHTTGVQRRVQVLKAVAHPVRLALVAELARRPLHVNALADALGVPQSIVSQQLRILRMTNLVHVQRGRGRAVYALAEPHLKGLLKCMDRCCAPLR
jgi:DNA-binding transcriptional ArsR family regulator